MRARERTCSKRTNLKCVNAFRALQVALLQVCPPLRAFSQENGSEIDAKLLKQVKRTCSKCRKCVNAFRALQVALLQVCPLLRAFSQENGSEIDAKTAQTG